MEKASSHMSFGLFLSEVHALLLEPGTCYIAEKQLLPALFLENASMPSVACESNSDVWLEFQFSEFCVTANTT